MLTYEALIARNRQLLNEATLLRSEVMEAELRAKELRAMTVIKRNALRDLRAMLAERHAAVRMGSAT